MNPASQPGSLAFMRRNPLLSGLLVAALVLLAFQIVGSVLLTRQLGASFALTENSVIDAGQPVPLLERDLLLLLNLVEARERPRPEEIEVQWARVQMHWEQVSSDPCRAALITWAESAYYDAARSHATLEVAMMAWASKGYPDGLAAIRVAGWLRQMDADLLELQTSYSAGQSAQLAEHASTAAALERVIEISGYTLTFVFAALALAILRQARSEQQSATARETSRFKNLFIASVSHELRTPLSSILGYTELLLEGMAGPIEARQHQYLERIIANGERLLTLIDDTLAISQLDAGVLVLRQVPFDPRALLNDVVNEYRPQAQSKGLVIRSQVEDNLPALLVGDPDRLHQMIENLLSNAVKYTDQGQVKVLMRREGAAEWQIRVEDSGAGIAESELSQIFVEFQRLPLNLDPGKRGSGLGLAVVQRLAGLMKGQIQVQSVPDQGSVFVLSLPLVLNPGSKE